MTPEQQNQDQDKRKGFMLDPDVPSDKQAHSKDVPYHTHDIGHLAPSMAFAWDTTKDGPWYHTYLMTNVAPQGRYFNEHPWAMLERKTREFTKNNNVDIYVITGVIQASPAQMVDGDAVPAFYFKALCDEKNGQSFVSIGENNNDCKECGVSNLQAVSAVEAKLGYKIFPSSCNPSKVDEKYWNFYPSTSVSQKLGSAKEKECSEHFADGMIPDTDGTFLCRKNGDKTFFATVYDTKIHCPKFSAYKMTPEQQNQDKDKRKGFMLDPDVPSDKQAHSKDAPYHTHDIGHLAPSMAFAWDTTKDGPWYHTYLMTNVAPQGRYFNEHPWAMLEKKTREFTKNNNVDVYVITGVIQASPAQMVDGDAVPAFYFKALCDEKNGQSFVSIGENNNDCKECGVSNLQAVSVVEAKLGYQIFPSSCNPSKVDEKYWNFYPSMIVV